MSLDIKKTLFLFFYIKSKNVITNISMRLEYGNTEIEEIKNSWFDHSFGKLKERIEYEYYKKFEDSGLRLNYNESITNNKNKNLDAEGIIILESKNKNIIVPLEYNEEIYNKLSILYEYKEKQKYYETLEQIESTIKILEEGSWEEIIGKNEIDFI